MKGVLGFCFVFCFIFASGCLSQALGFLLDFLPPTVKTFFYESRAFCFVREFANLIGGVCHHMLVRPRLACSREVAKHKKRDLAVLTSLTSNHEVEMQFEFGSIFADGAWRERLTSAVSSFDFSPFILSTLCAEWK